MLGESVSINLNVYTQIDPWNLFDSGGDETQPAGVAYSGGKVYAISDSTTNKTRITVNPGQGDEVLVIPNTNVGYLDGVNTVAQFKQPSAIAADQSGNMYIADTGNCRIRKIAAVTYSVSTVAGGDCSASPVFVNISGIALDSSDNIYVTESANGAIYFVTPSGTVSKINATDSNTGLAATFTSPKGIAYYSTGTSTDYMYVTQTDGSIRKITVSK